jgi:steroid delta-isomerase-like uncharacterized protein
MALTSPNTAATQTYAQKPPRTSNPPTTLAVTAMAIARIAHRIRNRCTPRMIIDHGPGRGNPASLQVPGRPIDAAFAAPLGCGSVALDEALRKRREEICVGHLTTENAHDFDRAIGYFARPRYDLLATGEVYDGAAELGRLMHENVTAFPDFHYEVLHMHHADEAIVVEGRFRGTHRGTWRGLPSTGRTVDFPMLIVFPFEGESMMGERIYFDLNTALRQLGVARDPNTASGKIATVLNHPLTIGRALFRSLARRR